MEENTTENHKRHNDKRTKLTILKNGEGGGGVQEFLFLS